MRVASVIVAAALALGASSQPALAGPPFVTDDPAPTDFGHWEIYNFAIGVHTPGDTAGEAGFDLNYGAAKDMQLTLVLPLAYDDSPDGRVSSGTVEMAVKYQLLHQDREGLDLAVFPRLFLPTAGRDLGSSHAALLLPIWVQRDVGKWSLFGGGGYEINPGPDQRNFWTGGVTLLREVNARLSIGAEVYHQTPDAFDARPFTGANLGVLYRLTPHWSLLAAGGPGLQNAASQGRYDFYLALKADY